MMQYIYMCIYVLMLMVKVETHGRRKSEEEKKDVLRRSRRREGGGIQRVDLKRMKNRRI